MDMRDLLSRGELDAIKLGEVERDNEPSEPDQSYDGEFRYVNCSPMKLRRMMAEEENPQELEAMQTAMDFHVAKGNTAGSFEAGYVERGDPRKDIRHDSLRGTLGRREEHITVRGGLVVPGEGNGETGWLDEGLADIEEMPDE